MDLQAASSLTGLSSRLTKFGALLCFVLACGILIASLAAPAGSEPLSQVHTLQVLTAR